MGEKKKKKKNSDRRRLVKNGDDDGSGSAEENSEYWSKGMEYYVYIRYKYTHDKKGKRYHKDGEDYKLLAKMCVSSWSPTRFWKALVGEDPPQSYVMESDEKSDDKKDKKKKGGDDADASSEASEE